VSNFISVFDNALPAALCATLVEHFDARPNQQALGRTGHGVDTTKKHSRDITLDNHRDWKLLQQEVVERALTCLCEYARRHHFLLVGALSPTVRHPSTGSPATLDDNNFAAIGAAFVPALLRRCFRLGVMKLQRYEQTIGGYPHWHSEIYPESNQTEALHRVLFWLCYCCGASPVT
jgi:hypothetical protein